MPLQHTYPPVNQSVVDTGCYVTAVGSANHRRGQPYPPPGHPAAFNYQWASGRVLPDAVLLGTAHGVAEWQTDRGRGVLRRGVFLFLPPGEWHRYRPLPGSSWGETWLCLRGELLHRLIERGIVPGQAEVRKCDRGRAGESRLDGLRDEIIGQPGRNLLSWGSRALSILLELWETPVPGDEPRGSARDEDDLVSRALRYIRQSCHRPIRVRDVAEACGCSRRTLERRFDEVGAESVADTITAQRLTRAKHLLQDTRLAVKQVAGDSGFGSPQNFIACFHRWEGCTPTQYRRRERSAV